MSNVKLSRSKMHKHNRKTVKRVDWIWESGVKNHCGDELNPISKDSGMQDVPPRTHKNWKPMGIFYPNRSTCHYTRRFFRLVEKYRGYYISPTNRARKYSIIEWKVAKNTNKITTAVCRRCRTDGDVWPGCIGTSIEPLLVIEKT